MLKHSGVDLESKTKSNSSSDHPRIRNEADLTECYVFLMTKQLNEVDKTRSADESSDKNYNYFKQNEFPRPLVLPIGEKAETKVSKDKSFETESN